MSDKSATRKLAAILAADVAGYSRLMAQDEAATVDALNEARAIFRERVEGHRGRILDTAGDSVLAEFPSPVEAVTTATEIQQILAQTNAILPPERRMRFRIGLNLGDVIEEGGTLYGDGVNVAARLQELAEPGGLCISGTVFDQVDGKLPLKFISIGEQSVKNIPKPIRAYQAGLETKNRTSSRSRNRWLVSAGALVLVALIGAGIVWNTESSGTKATVAPIDPSLALPTGPVIAVLPFDNMSGDPKQDYFGDGLSEEIIAGLSRFGNLRVLARNTTFQFKGKAVDIREIGQQFGADYVIEGSVRRQDGIVRVTAQLLDAKTGTHVWAETYQRKLDTENLFAVQDAITSQVVTRIGDVHGAVNRAQIQQVRSKNNVSLADYECVLLAYEYQRFLTPDKHANAKTCLTRTVQRNPNYAEAWANLSYTYVDQYWGQYAGPPEPLVLALQAARRAVDLDPISPLAHYQLANVYFFLDELDAFLHEAETALKLNPNNTEVVAALGLRMIYSGHEERGIALIHKAISLNPSHPGWYWMPLVYYHYQKRDYKKALEMARRIDMPGFFYTHFYLASCYAQLGRKIEAHAALEELRRLNPTFEKDPLKYLGQWMKLPDAREHMLDGLRKAGMAMPQNKN